MPSQRGQRGVVYIVYSDPAASSGCTFLASTAFFAGIASLADREAITSAWRSHCAKPVLDFVKPAANWTTQQVQAAKESAAGKAVNKAVESTVQQVKDSHAGQAVGSTTQRVKETPAGQAINKAFNFVGELFAPFPEATQAYLEPDSNMPAPPPAYWRRAPPPSPSASRRAAMENAKVRPPPAPKELV